MHTYQIQRGSVCAVLQGLLSGTPAHCVLILLFLAISSCSQTSAEITLTRVVDTATTVPGGVGEFTRFDSLNVDGGTLVFSHGRDGIYRLRDGHLESVADANTTLPDGSRFFDLRYPAIDGDTIVFWGRTSTSEGSRAGVYRVIEDEVSVVADTNTLLPDGNGRFGSFDPPVVHGGRVVFRAETDSGEGVYLFDEHLRTIADTSTAAPNDQGLFQQFAYRVQVDNGNVFFHGRAASGDGIFAEIDGQIERIVSEDSSDLRAIADFSSDGESVIFRGVHEDGRHGIYTTAMGGDGLPALIADQDSFEESLYAAFPFPRSSTPLASENGIAVLATTSDREYWVLWHREGEWMQVARSDELLDGLTISSIEVFDGHELSDTQLGFVVNFEGDRRAVYLATVPEPSTLALLLVCCLPALRLLDGRRARRGETLDEGR